MILLSVLNYARVKLKLSLDPVLKGLTPMSGAPVGLIRLFYFISFSVFVVPEPHLD